MTTWWQFADEAPDLAAPVRRAFSDRTHHVLATLRADGSPRVSGTEVRWHGPDLTLGSMRDARKAGDLRRDGRCAVHAHPADPSMAGGDAKVSGRAVEVVDEAVLAGYTAAYEPPGQFHLFQLALDEVVHTAVDGDQLSIRLWRPGGGVREFRR